MDTLKKAFCIGFGTMLFVLGLGCLVIFIFITNLDIGQKVIGAIGSLMAMIFGWWLVRRGSNSVRDAIGWLFNLIPW